MMLIIVGIVFIILGCSIVWFYIPYSPVKNTFYKDMAVLEQKNYESVKDEVYTKEEFSHLPISIQKYIQHCGYIGTPKMSYMKIAYEDVDFMQGINGPALTIDYVQYNFIKNVERIALIQSSMYGVPFEGYDYYIDGTGGMKGVIAKGITLFNQTGKDMDKACLVTYLAESLFAPEIILQDYITFEEISKYVVQATITYNDICAKGVFTFNEEYEMMSFYTEDRAITNEDGSMEYVPWSAICGEFKTYNNGIKYPSKFKAVWHYPKEDFIYFDGKVKEIEYDSK